MNQFLMVLCGLPASGKTTLALAIKRAVGPDVEIVTSDKWRDETYYIDWKPEKEGAVRKKSLAQVRERIQQGKSVIHDDTNYYQSMRHELYKIALERKCLFTIIHVTTSVDNAILWNAKREHSEINEDIIRKIADRFDPPGGRYLWDYPSVEVDMATHVLEKAVTKIVALLRSLKTVEDSQPVKVTEQTGEAIDQITRKAVTEFLTTHPEFRETGEVSIIRRRVLRNALESEMPLDEIFEITLCELSGLLENQAENED
jgi:O-phosphoseryl-tRNA(Sec) kinase